MVNATVVYFFIFMLTSLSLKADLLKTKTGKPEYIITRDLKKTDGLITGRLYKTQTGEGFNTYFITSYLNHLYGYKNPSASNMHPITYQKIKDTLAIFQGSSTHHFREGVELGTFFKTKGKISHLNEMVQILRLYQKANASLIITFGLPAPAWMQEGISDVKPWCPIPQAEKDWARLKNDLSHSIGLLFTKLWNHPHVSKKWLQEKVLIEPINEMDSLGTFANGKCSRGLATGKRGADLSNGIEWVLRKNNVPMAVVMPSAHGTEWFKDYYQSGGRGQPNIHLYTRYEGPESAKRSSTFTSLTKIENELIMHQNVVPDHFKKHFILGEFGMSEINKLCQFNKRAGGALSGDAYDHYLVDAFGHTRIKEIAPTRLVWRINDVKKMNYNKAGCELTFGAFDEDMIPKNQLIKYLEWSNAIVNKKLYEKGTKASDIIRGFYKKYLYREADRKGLNYWVKYHENGRSLSEVENHIKNSPEAKISVFYIKYLKRGPDVGGMTYWLKDNLNGQSFDQIRDNIRRSKECKVDCIK